MTRRGQRYPDEELLAAFAEHPEAANTDLVALYGWELTPWTVGYHRRKLGYGRWSHNTAKTKCPKGHPYDKANTYYSKRGSRACRQCRRIRQRVGPNALFKDFGGTGKIRCELCGQPTLEHPKAGPCLLFRDLRAHS